MAGFNPLDIRSEMAAAGVGRNDPTTPPSIPELAIVPVEDVPVPLAIIAPGEPGNAIDVENPPDFQELNRMNPPPPLRRLSKRQAGVDPECHPTKHYKQSLPRRFQLDPDFSSDSDSSDDDFELVARPKGSQSGATATTLNPTMEADPELDISLASYLLMLKAGKAKVNTDTTTTSTIRTSAHTSQREDSPDEEMDAEFAANRPHKSDSSTESSSYDSSSSSEFVAEEGSTDSQSSTDEPNESALEEVQGVAHGVGNTDDNAIDYVLSLAVSAQFYSDTALSLWPLYATREFIREKLIDVASYERQNIVELLRLRHMFSTTTTAMPFCRKPVLEFYANLTSDVGTIGHPRYGRVYVRNKIYTFTPGVINEFFNTFAVPDDGSVPIGVDEATAIVTGGVIVNFPLLPQRLAAASLTSLYSVFHKIAICNWTPSSNSTIVTRPQVCILAAIGTGKSFDYGHHVFSTILAFANGGLKSTRLPFPSLIYGILESQNFQPSIDDVLTSNPEILKLGPALLKGNRKIDLPWSNTQTDSSPAPEFTSPAPATFMPPMPSTTNVPTDFLKSQLEYALDQIKYYEEQATFLRRLLSGQQGGDRRK